MVTDTQDKICLKCGNKSGKQFTCNGCQQSFCWSHITDHQQDIIQQMDALTQNHDRLQNDWNDRSDYDRLSQQIDQWEKESIMKIREIADTARTDLKVSYEESKNHCQSSIQRISQEILTSQKLNNYSEIEINQWTKQLKYIQQQVESSFNIRINQDEQISSIKLIKIKQKTKYLLEQNEQTTKRLRNENNERFDKVFGNAILSQENLLATNDLFSRSFISGFNSYSTGIHSLHLTIEQVRKKGSSCFFGMMTSTQDMKEFVHEMTSVYGVWSSGYIVRGGERSAVHGDRRWGVNDYVILTFDCDNKKMSIENKRINWCQLFDVNLDLCPFPWKFLIIMKRFQIRIKNDF